MNLLFYDYYITFSASIVTMIIKLSSSYPENVSILGKIQEVTCFSVFSKNDMQLF